MPIQHFSLETTNHTPSTSSTQSTNGNVCKVLIAITVPTRNWKYIFKVRTDILIGELRKQAIETYNLKEIDFINYGLYLPPDCSKKGKFLQDERIISEYPQLVTTKFDSDEKTNATTDHVMHSDQLIHQINKHDHNNDNNNNKNNEIIDGNKIKEPVLLELLPKIRFVEEYRSEGSKTTTRRIHSKHHQKRLLSAIKRDDVNRVNDLLNQGLDPNFQYPSKGITPLGCTTELNDPREMILQLVNAGAHLDYRDSDTMTALHRAAICGNLKAIEVFLELGQNPNVRDKHNLTPLYYACSEDIKPECIQRLLFDHAILGVTDDKGRQEIHQACLNGRVKTLRQLIIYGADLNAQVENHNTPLHLCVLADEMECMQMLLSCGASPTIMNSSGQTPYELAILIERMNLAKILQNFDEKSVEGINQKPIYNKDRRPTIHGPRAVYDSVYFTHNNNNNISKCQLNKCLSVDNELPKANYNRSISFDINEIRKPKPTQISQSLFINSNNESQLPMFTKPNHNHHNNNSNNVKQNTTNYSNNNSNIINNRPSLDIKQQSITNNSDNNANNNNGGNNNLGRTIYNRSNSQNLLKLSRRINLLRQRFPNCRIRSIALERGVSGYGFIMQGSNSLKERITTRNNLPSQRIMSVQPNSKAEKSGLVPGDYLLEINGIDVYDATHTEVVDLITATRDMLNLKIINFQQIPEIRSRVFSELSNHNTNINHSSNSSTKVNRTSFIRADLRRRNTQRSISVDTPWINRQMSITTDSHKTNNHTNITTNTTTTTDNSSTSSCISNNSNFISTNDKSLLPDQTLRHYRRYNDNNNNIP
ncbi:SH3 and multiple ankyrin repeat-containing protein [Schistosoma japonicum]|uniref:SH3 and multiple ankyrin repeat-containing protein n=1 Tax=Schistosoma japonicum TaxID=6182 RepID=A0A4Z2CP77_SCHJA|nr:SH3 and multiple ankyrin repeat-containing protein [Schistosoma japonicum]